jgi:hypothetical protein
VQADGVRDTGTHLDRRVDLEASRSGRRTTIGEVAEAKVVEGTSHLGIVTAEPPRAMKTATLAIVFA